MTAQDKSSRLSRRDFLRIAGLGVGAGIVGLSFGAQGVMQGVRVARAQAARAGTLRVGWTTPVQLDPALFADAPDISIGRAVYDYLVTTNQKLQILPGLAQSWEVSPDGKEYTFKLQAGVKFHDGSDFGANDVKFTFDRLRDPATGSAAASLFTELDSIEVVDPTTVKFILKNPVGPFLGFLADYHACILKEGTQNPAEVFNGTGPFKRVSIDTTDRAVFEANPNYWKPGEPKVETLELIFASKVEDLVPALQGGEIQFLPRLNFAQYDLLSQTEGVTAVKAPSNQFSYLRIRADRGPGEKIEVRQALRLAIDRAALNQTVLEGLGDPGRDSPIGPLYGDFYTEATPLPARNVEEAKKLLATAGYENGFDITLYYPEGEENSDDIAQLVASQWKQAGVNVALQSLKSDAYYGDGPNNWLDADLAITFWASRPDPQNYLDLMLHSNTGGELGKWNEAHLADEELDKNIDAARTEPDVKKRAGYMAEIQRIMIERGPGYIPFFRPLLAARRSNVSGIELAPDPGLTSFSTAEIKA